MLENIDSGEFMKRKQVKQFWIRDILKNREEFVAFNAWLGELKKGCEYFFIVFFSSCNNAI